MPRVFVHCIVIAFTLELISGSCPEGFQAFQDGCFFASKKKGTFADCQSNICGNSGASLAAITSQGLNDFLYDLLEGDVGFLGLYESGPDESGDWRWVDGTPLMYREWHEGEPNNWCLDEDCAIFIPGSDTRMWFDASCAIQVKCLCQLGQSPSLDYKSMQNKIAATEPADYNQCRGGECFWQRSIRFRGIFMLAGFPCFMLLALVILSSCGLRISCKSDLQSVADFASQSAVPSTSYGFILDASDFEVDVDSVVDRWVVRGAFGAIMYSFALLALAATMAFHTNGAQISFFVDAFEALIMSVSKFSVAFCAHIVHKHLSPVSRMVVGKWILVLASSKALMGICALALAFVYAAVEIHGTEGPVFCWLGYIFCWSLLTSNIFQSVAGLAFWRIHVGAVQYVGDEHVFSKVVHCWFPVLVYGTFGVGVSLYTCGFLFVFQQMFDDIEPVNAMPFFYLAAATSQLIAGIAMLMTNCMIRRYFQSPQISGTIKTAIEMRARSSTTGGASQIGTSSQGD